MAYSRAWNEATPTDSTDAPTIDDLFRNLKVDVRERMNDVVADWTADPVIPQGSGTFRAKGILTASQSIPTGSATSLNWDGEAYDVGDLHDLVTNNDRITVPTGGDGAWLFGTVVDWFSNATGHRIVRLMKNGTAVSRSIVPAVGDDFTTQVITFPLEVVVATDYYSIQVEQNSGSSVSVNLTYSAFWGMAA